MDAVTYPNAKVIDFLQDKVIPLQLTSNAKPESDDYNVKWTPHLAILDADGKEHHKIVGFLPAPEFIAAVLLGVGKAAFGFDKFDEAIANFDQTINEYAYTSSAPEAVFFRAVCLYKSTHQPGHLRDAYEKLQVEYHCSEWAQRAFPYWLIPPTVPAGT